jgi:hypothetical protein
MNGLLISLQQNNVKRLILNIKYFFRKINKLRTSFSSLHLDKAFKFKGTVLQDIKMDILIKKNAK